MLCMISTILLFMTFYAALWTTLQLSILDLPSL